MNLFTPDLYRNFGIGFAAGAVLAAAGNMGTIIAAIPPFFSTLF